MPVSRSGVSETGAENPALNAGPTVTNQPTLRICNPVDLDPVQQVRVVLAPARQFLRQIGKAVADAT